MFLDLMFVCSFFRIRHRDTVIQVQKTLDKAIGVPAPCQNPYRCGKYHADDREIKNPAQNNPGEIPPERMDLPCLVCIEPGVNRSRTDQIIQDQWYK